MSLWRLTDERCQSRPQRARAALLVGGLALLALLVGPLASWADEDQPKPTAMERLFPGLDESMKDLPAFFRDTDLTIYLRSYYLTRESPDGAENEAWAFGGWFSYRSGWLFDMFAIGATVYGSAPIYAPDDKDGTTLLKPGQEGYGVLGEAYAALRYKEYVLAKGYRQEVSQGYINREDNRMTPNTFEGLTVGGKLGPVDYLAGYLWKFKARNDDDFVYMSEAAGAPGSEDGVVMAGVKFSPVAGLKLDLSEQYGINTFNTVFLQADYTHPLAEDLRLIFGGQFTDQRAVGDQLLTNTSTKDWDTYNVSAKAGGRLSRADRHPRRLDHRRRAHDPGAVGELPGLPLADPGGLPAGRREGGSPRRRLRFLEAGHARARGVRQHRLRLGRDRPEDPGGGAGPDRVRPHDRLPAAQRVSPAPDDPESLVPAPRRHSRPGERRPARLAGSIHRELGDPDSVG